MGKVKRKLKEGMRREELMLQRKLSAIYYYYKQPPKGKTCNYHLHVQLILAKGY